MGSPSSATRRSKGISLPLAFIFNFDSLLFIWKETWIHPFSLMSIYYWHKILSTSLMPREDLLKTESAERRTSSFLIRYWFRFYCSLLKRIIRLKIFVSVMYIDTSISKLCYRMMGSWQRISEVSCKKVIFSLLSYEL